VLAQESSGLDGERLVVIVAILIVAVQYFRRMELIVMCFLSLSFIVTFSAMDIRDGESTQSRSIFDAVFNGRWSS